MAITPDQGNSIRAFAATNPGSDAIAAAKAQYGVSDVDYNNALFAVKAVGGGHTDYNDMPWQNQAQGAQPQPASQPMNLGMSGGAPSGGGGSGNSYSGGQNPYLADQANAITNQMTSNWTRNLAPSIRSGAVAAGGFGGSRQGVVEANGLNDMNRSLGQNLTNMYSQDYTNSQNRNLQQQSINNGYDLGLRSSDLGFAGLDANIAQNNFGNQLASANFGMNAYGALNGQTQAGINAGTNIQNTPLEYQKYFTNSANGTGSGFASSTGSTTAQGNPYMSALGGAMMGNNLYNQYNKG